MALEWQNEQSLSAYPLGTLAVHNEPFVSELAPGLLVDAVFMQFDGFVPVLESVTFSKPNIILNIIFDEGPVSVTAEVLDSGVPEPTQIRGKYDRWLGCLVWGDESARAMAAYAGRVIRVRIPFAASTVRPVSSKAGLYFLNGKNNRVTWITDGVMFLDSVGDNTIRVNAIAYPEIDGVSGNVLRSINGTGPLAHNIMLEGGELLKFNASGENTVKVTLANQNIQLAPAISA